MLKKLDASYEKEMLSLMANEKELNLFIIGDIENYGFETPFLEYWGQFEDDTLTGILMRYHDGFTVYAEDRVDVEGVMAIISEYDPETLCGGKRLLKQFAEKITYGTQRDTYFAKLDHTGQLVNTPLIDQVRKTQLSEINDIQFLLEERIDEFDQLEDIERKVSNYESGATRGYHLRSEDGKLVASAETAAENSQSAMVIAVATDPNHRHKGYATTVMSKLCGDLLEEGKSLCLFYDNPSAGDVYKRIGFQDIDIWSMWRMKTPKEV